MSMRFLAGVVSAFYNPLKVPNAPNSISATGGDAEATVSFTAPADVGGGAITGYGAVAIKTSDGTTATATGAASPLTVTGLTNGSAYTMNVWALNTFGPSPFSAASGSISPAAIRGIFAGGSTGSGESNVIDYFNIGTQSSATDFGDLTVARTGLSSCASSTRGVFASGSGSNVMDYVTIASVGNATDFGDYINQGSSTAYFGGCNSSTRGVFGGGYSNTGTGTELAATIKYITIATTGNNTTFGNLATAAQYLTACSSSTRGVFGGGVSTTVQLAAMNYVTIATTGNSVSFGNLTAARQGLAACSSATRGVFGGGSGASNFNIIDYITIATTGAAADFGDLTSIKYNLGACSSSTRGLFGGGSTPVSSYTTTTNYVTIATTGNAASFGDLTQGRLTLTACSNGNGGVQ